MALDPGEAREPARGLDDEQGLELAEHLGPLIVPPLVDGRVVAVAAVARGEEGQEARPIGFGG
ncbi:hypothetical protein D3C72_2067840 [compost metagenome]